MHSTIKHKSKCNAVPQVLYWQGVARFINALPLPTRQHSRLANLEPERTVRILAAAEGEKKPVVDKLLNTRQAAAVLGCHPKTLLRYGLSGRLHPVRRSKRLLRWRQSEIEKMLMGEV